MSDRCHSYRNGLKKMINGNKVYLSWGFSLVRGLGWFCQVYNYSKWNNTLKYGFGFSKNKFTAYRNALSKLK